MAVRMLQDSDSLDSIWEECVYSEARLAHDEHAKDLTPVMGKLVARVEKTWQSQRAVWRAEILAQAGVDATDDELDVQVTELSQALLLVTKGDRKHPRFVRYFSESPTHIVRLGLQSEVERVRGWPASLKGETEKPLIQLGKGIDATLSAADKVLADRVAAASARADHRVREIVALVEDANAARLSVYGALALRVEKHGLPRDWPSGFFRRATRTPRVAAAPVPTSPAAPSP